MVGASVVRVAHIVMAESKPLSNRSQVCERPASRLLRSTIHQFFWHPHIHAHSHAEKRLVATSWLNSHHFWWRKKRKGNDTSTLNGLKQVRNIMYPYRYLISEWRVCRFGVSIESGSFNRFAYKCKKQDEKTIESTVPNPWHRIGRRGVSLQGELLIIFVRGEGNGSNHLARTKPWGNILEHVCSAIRFKVSHIGDISLHIQKISGVRSAPSIIWFWYLLVLSYNMPIWHTWHAS